MPVDCNPISEDKPVNLDHKRNLALEAFLDRHGRIEPKERGQWRQQALVELHEIGTYPSSSAVL